MRQLSSLAILVGLALLSVFFMASAYSHAREEAIAQLSAQERILAEQASQGIAAYFTSYRQLIQHVAGNPEVVASTPAGQQRLRDLFRAQRDNLLSLTRVGPDGRILFTHPDERAAGRYILDQPHVGKLFSTRQPVVSSVFRAVQGFDCVALHVPVFDGDRFAGSLAVLFPFDVISRRFLSGVRIGESGHAFLLSREGIELFCPFAGHTGRPITETMAGLPAGQDLAARMLRGETGAAVYDYDEGNPGGPRVQKHAYFKTVPLEDTFWSIAVTAPDAEALAFIQGFRNRWAAGFVLLFVAFVGWGTMLARAYLLLGREQARQLAQERVLAAEREREQALRESEERFRTYFESSLLAMAITSPAKRWLLVNDRFTALLGYSREELQALDWAQITHEDDLAESVARFDRMLAGEVEGFSFEKRFRRKDGSVVDTIVSTRLMRLPDGTPEYCLTHVQDITERKRLEVERAQLDEHLRQAQKLDAIGRLAGGIAHDYNNLLTVQLGHLAMLKDGAPMPAEARRSLAEVEKSALMAAQLTSQLLAFGRRQVLQVRRLDLNDAVRSVTELLRRVLPEKVALHVRTGARPLWVDADAGSLEQVVMNLVVNARDAMPDGGRLSVSTALVSVEPGPDAANPGGRSGTFVRLEVADTGKGMSPEVRSRIFEPFFTTKESGGGCGLGLATVHGIVEQHGGWIEVDTAEGRGSVFRVHFEAAAMPASAPAPAEAPALNGRQECILLAEDNEAVRRMLVRLLERMNYRVLAAENASEALRVWRSHTAEIDLLLSDMVMTGGESGLDLARTLRRDRPGLRVVIMSGHSQELAGAGLEPDMAFLGKPWTHASLAHALGAA